MELLNMRGICKAFDGVPVLQDVRLTVGTAEAHALLGENGAGKSTLMNILTGVYGRDAGTIVFDGKACDAMTVQESEAAGIAFVHQELNLFNDLTVAENLFLTREPVGPLGRIDKKRMHREAAALFASMGVEMDPALEVRYLKTSQKQLLEIAKALRGQAKLIILDEPTTALNTREVEHLFAILRRLKEQNGTSFLFISHKMPEVFAFADRYTVLSNGRFVAEGAIADTTPEKITEQMVGHPAGQGAHYAPRPTGETVLDVQNLTGPGFAGVSLTARKGEIIGLTGLQGSGSSEWMQAVFGALPVQSGTVAAFGKAVKPGSIHRAMAAGIAMLPGNRKENSVIPDLNLVENLTLAEQTLSARDFPIRKKAEGKIFDHYKEILHIKARGAQDAITSLSGGNQQKVFLARWLNTGAGILLLDNPTQGIDVGAKEEIYALILELAARGKTLLINTLEIPELQKVADRCAVFYEGRLVRMLPHEEINEHTVMLWSTGASLAKEEQPS